MSKRYEELAKKEKQILDVVNNQLDDNMGDFYKNGKTEELKKTLEKIANIADEMRTMCDEIDTEKEE